VYLLYSLYLCKWYQFEVSFGYTYFQRRVSLTHSLSVDWLHSAWGFSGEHGPAVVIGGADLLYEWSSVRLCSGAQLYSWIMIFSQHRSLNRGCAWATGWVWLTSDVANFLRPWALCYWCDTCSYIQLEVPDPLQQMPPKRKPLESSPTIPSPLQVLQPVPLNICEPDPPERLLVGQVQQYLNLYQQQRVGIGKTITVIMMITIMHRSSFLRLRLAWAWILNRWQANRQTSQLDPRSEWGEKLLPAPHNLKMFP